jgi:hypothetical protein
VPAVGQCQRFLLGNKQPRRGHDGLFGDVGIHELQKVGELAGAPRGCQETSVRGQEDERVDGHAVEGLSLTDDAEDDVGQVGGGPEQEPALEGACGDFDEGIVGTWSGLRADWFPRLPARDRCCPGLYRGGPPWTST